ncbi:hypothetical protein CCB80_11110 [Armatimonadetes bacterium Uphvl-Ar1]|nr:hypothetical protein CCB80_11110 [Armatimonadetes bacterium Uphvl-Ar1]
MEIGTQPSGRTALLGAGFSKNFGGFLASEMTSKVFFEPGIKSNKLFADALREKYNYENALAQIRKEGNIEQVRQFEEAVANVYRKQNEQLCKPNLNRFDYKSFYNLQKFFDRLFRSTFHNDKNRSSNLFTLNQDSFLEFVIQNANGPTSYGIPGIKQESWHFQNGGGQLRPDQQLNKKILVEDSIDAVDKINWAHGTINYIKLHGSAEWKNEAGDLLVVGGDKQAFLSKSPLLTAYQTAFK